MIPDAPQNKRKKKSPTSSVLGMLGGGGGQQYGGQGQAQQIQNSLGGFGFDPFDFSADPILAAARAASARGRQEAEANYNRDRLRMAIEYGDESIGGEAAKNNPFSFLAKQAKAEQEEPVKQNEGFGTLFFSSTADKARTDLASNLLERRTSGAKAYSGGMEGLARILRGEMLGFDEDEQGALSGAAERRRETLGDTAYAQPRRPSAASIVSNLAKRPKYGRPRLPIRGGYDG